MRGIVFTELLDMVEEEHGYEFVDRLLQKVKPGSGGAYTSVGSYPHQELVGLVIGLSQELRVPIDALLEQYGKHLFGVFAVHYSALFSPGKDSFQFLSSVESHIHPEVLKLYPDAELPSFDIESKGDGQLVMIYKSRRKMGAFALGLIKGCLDHFNEDAEILMEKLNEDATRVRFTISRRA